MKKLRVIAMASDRDQLLSGLLHLGCMQIEEPTDKLADPEWTALLRRENSALAERRNQLAEVNAALETIKVYSETKEKALQLRPTVTEQYFLSEEATKEAAETSHNINETLKTLEKLQRREARIESNKAGLEPWKRLDLPLNDTDTVFTVGRLEVCPASVNLRKVRKELDAEEVAAAIYKISEDKLQKYTFLLCLREDEEKAQEILRPHGFSVTSFPNRTGTAKETIAMLEEMLVQNRKDQAEALETLKRSDASLEDLRLYADRLETEVGRETSTEALLTDGTIIFFEGWAPTRRMKGVSRLLNGLGCAWDFTDPTEEEYPDVPVLLENNWFTRPLNMVTDMYSLPAYNSLDPNPLIAFFFILFYGMMMADMGYGIVMILLAAFVIKKSRPNGPTMKHMMPLMGYCGVATFLFGILTGSFFGAFIPRLTELATGTAVKMPGLGIDPVTYAVPILIFSLILGAIQIFVGMGASICLKLRRKQILDAVCNEITWYAVFILVGRGIITGQKEYIWATLVLLVLTQGYGKPGVAGKVMGVFGSIYSNVTGYFSDILSYSRLMALMLAGAVIAQVFNTIGQLTGNVVLYFIIALIGNVLNFALNLLSCYVHDMRLQCLEFFKRFYEDGGKPFEPLAIKTKYVDIVNK